MLGRQMVHFEAPEAGRYHAPLLLLPGLYQSFGCWRPFTSLLAHRGWELYCLPRTLPDEDAEELITEDDDWEACRAKVVKVASLIGDRVILLGADIGAALALSLADEISPLALGMFSPCAPSRLGPSASPPRGFFSRFRPPANTQLLPTADPSLVPEGTDPGDLLPEPSALLRDLGKIEFNAPTRQPPTIVFNSTNDPLVSASEAGSFVDGTHAKAARSSLDGHWWPGRPGAVAAADELQRFLILTLGDRVVEFPDEILND